MISSKHRAGNVSDQIRQSELQVIGWSLCLVHFDAKAECVDFAHIYVLDGAAHTHPGQARSFSAYIRTCVRVMSRGIKTPDIDQPTRQRLLLPRPQWLRLKKTPKP